MNKKIIQTTVALGAAISIGSISDTNKAQANEQTTNDDLVIKQVVPTEPSVTKEQVDDAKTNVTNVQTKVDEVTTKANNNLANTQKIQEDLTSTQNTINEVKDIDKTVKDIDEKINTNTDLVDKATQSKNELTNTLENTKNDLTKQQDVINNTKDQVNTLTKEKDKLNEEVKNLSSSSNELTKKQEELDKTNEIKNKAQDVLKAKEDELANSSKTNEKLNKDIEDIKKQTVKANEDRSKLNDEYQTLKTKEDKALDTLNNLNDKTFGNAKLNISVSNEFVKAFKEYQNKVSSLNPSDPNQSAKLQAALKEVIKVEESIKDKLKFPQGYQYDNVDLIDINNMTQAEQEHFAQYFTYLVNQIRNQFGVEPIYVNRNTQSLATDIAKNIVKDDYRELGHYKKGINDAAAKHNLLTDYNSNYYENLYPAITYTKNPNKIPKAYLYDLIHFWTQGFFYEGTSTGNYLHARSLLNNVDNQGVAFSHIANTGSGYLDYKQGILKMSVIHVSKLLTNDYTNKYSKTSKAKLDLVKPVDVKQYQDAYTKAKAATSRALDKLDNQDALIRTLKATLKATQDNLVDVTKVKEDIKKANEIISQATSKITKLEQEIKAIQDNLSSNDKVLKEKLTKYNQTLVELKDAQDKLNEQLSTYKTTLENAKEVKDKLTRVTNTLEELTQNLNKLKTNKQDLLSKAQNIKALEDKSATLKQELKDSQELDAQYTKELEELNKELEEKTKVYNELLKQYQFENYTFGVSQEPPVNEVPALDPANLHTEEDPSNPNPPSDKPNEEKPNVDEPSIDKPNNEKPNLDKPTTNEPTKDPVVNKPTTKGNTNVLPKTGATTNTYILAGILTLITGLGLTRRKRNK